MQRVIYVELAFSTAFVMTKVQDGLFSQEQMSNEQLVKKKSTLNGGVAFEQSVNFLKKKISELAEGDWQLFIMRMNKEHSEWVESLSANKNISLTLNPNYKEASICTEDLQQFKQSLFNFVQKPSILDIQANLENVDRTTLPHFPEQYLLASFHGNFQITLIKSQTRTLVYQSSLGQQFHLNIINTLLANNNLQTNNLDHIITSAFSKGDISITDLFVQDIFGKEKCSFIGLPPKLLAASLGKIAIDGADKRTVWDQIKSILVAFAINIGKQISLSKMSTGVRNVLFIAGEFYNPYFLKIIEGLVILKKIEIGFNNNYLFERFLSNSFDAIKQKEVK